MIQLDLSEFEKKLLIGAVIGSIGFVFLVLLNESPFWLIPTTLLGRTLQ